jgi:hypothetical protein
MGIAEKTHSAPPMNQAKGAYDPGGLSMKYFPIAKASEPRRKPKHVISESTRELGPVERMVTQGGPFQYKYRTIIAIDKDIASAPLETRLRNPLNARPPIVVGVDAGPQVDPGLSAGAIFMPSVPPGDTVVERKSFIDIDFPNYYPTPPNSKPPYDRPEDGKDNGPGDTEIIVYPPPPPPKGGGGVLTPEGILVPIGTTTDLEVLEFPRVVSRIPDAKKPIKTRLLLPGETVPAKKPKTPLTLPEPIYNPGDVAIAPKIPKAPKLPTSVGRRIPTPTSSALPPEALRNPDPYDVDDWVIRKAKEFYTYVEKAREAPVQPMDPPPPYDSHWAPQAIAIVDAIKDAIPGFKDKAYKIVAIVSTQLNEAFQSAVEIAIGSGIAVAKKAGYAIDMMKPSASDEFDYDFDYDFELKDLAKILVTTAMEKGDAFIENTVTPAVLKTAHIAAQEIIFRLLSRTRDLVPAILKIHHELTMGPGRPIKFKGPYNIPKDEPIIKPSKIVPFDWDQARRRAREKANERFEVSPVSPLSTKSKAHTRAKEKVMSDAEIIGRVYINLAKEWSPPPDQLGRTVLENFMLNRINNPALNLFWDALKLVKNSG